MTKDKDAQQAKFQTGDMLWGRVSGHPWWPCMVASGPDSPCHYRTIKRRQNIQVQYHVQYFGEENERGWIGEASLMPYTGRAAFERMQEERLNPAAGSNPSKRDRQSFVINSRRQKAWSTAVVQAEEALGLNAKDRLSRYTFVYPEVGPTEQQEVKSSSPKKRKRHASSSSSDRAIDQSLKSLSDSLNDTAEKEARDGNKSDSSSAAVSLARAGVRSGRAIKHTKRFAKHLEDIIKKKVRTSSQKASMPKKAPPSSQNSSLNIPHNHDSLLGLSNIKLENLDQSPVSNSKRSSVSNSLFVSPCVSTGIAVATGTHSNNIQIKVEPISDPFLEAQTLQQLQQQRELFEKHQQMQRCQQSPSDQHAPHQNLTQHIAQLVQHRNSPTHPVPQHHNLVKPPHSQEQLLQPLRVIHVQPLDLPEENELDSRSLMLPRKRQRRGSTQRNSDFNQRVILISPIPDLKEEAMPTEDTMVAPLSFAKCDVSINTEIDMPRMDGYMKILPNSDVGMQTSPTLELGSVGDEPMEVDLCCVGNIAAHHDNGGDDYSGIGGADAVADYEKGLSDARNVTNSITDAGYRLSTNDTVNNIEKETNEICNSPCRGRSSGFVKETINRDETANDVMMAEINSKVLGAAPVKDAMESIDDTCNGMQDDDVFFSDLSAGSPISAKLSDGNDFPMEEDLENTVVSGDMQSDDDLEQVQAGNHLEGKASSKRGSNFSNTDSSSSYTSEDMFAEDRTVNSQPYVINRKNPVNSDVSYISEGVCYISENKICLKCELPGIDLVTCQGSCQGHYHLSCIDPPSSMDDSTFTCTQCTSGVHSCFVCKEESPDTVKCSVKECGKYYHKECTSKSSTKSVTPNNVTSSPPQSLLCPRHACLTCVSETGKSTGRATKAGAMFSCIKCPRSFHANSFCLPASCRVIDGLDIICNAHLSQADIRHRNDFACDWCSICLEGNSPEETQEVTQGRKKQQPQGCRPNEFLFTCSTCPRSFHPSCYKVSPCTDSWSCKDCQGGRSIYYGEVVWAKMGNYRWWPGRVLPLNELKRRSECLKSTNPCEVAVYFFGSNLILWLPWYRLLPFEDGEHLSKEYICKQLLSRYDIGVKMASKFHEKWTEQKRGELFRDRKDGSKPAKYKHIKSNLPLGDVEIVKAPPSENPACQCAPDEQGFYCGPDSNCINRLIQYECHPLVCQGGDKCLNQRFSKRLDANIKPMKTSEKGWGLFALSPLEKGQFVGEYVGDLINSNECKRRLEEAQINGVKNFYMLTLDKNRIIDAGPKGNYTRFINHSCEPNCETQKWTVGGDVRVGIFALKDIPAGTELNFNYNLDCFGNEKTKCKCGSSICSGFLGVRPKTAVALEIERRSHEIKLRKEHALLRKSKKRGRPKLPNQS